MYADESKTWADHAFGDVTAVYRNSDSVLIGTYEYDLWGNPVSIKEAASERDTDGILKKNPFRYKCYYYDTETGFYYLNARYYDPQIRRFISADNITTNTKEDVLGYNLYSYCNNSPLNKTDSSGHFPKLSQIFKAISDYMLIQAALALVVVVIAATVSSGGGAAAVLAPICGETMTAGAIAAKAAIIADGALMASATTLSIAAEASALSLGASIAESAANNGFNKQSQQSNKSDTGNWNKGSFDSAEDSLNQHYIKHGKEVGATSREQYLRKAEEFAKTAKKGSTKSRVDGFVEGVTRYKKNGKFIDLAPDGSIISFGSQ